jgi:glycosyltransferase involved in cell wall biosynthesis
MLLTSEKIRVMRIIARMNVGGPAVQVTGISKNLDSTAFEHLLVTGYCESNEIEYLESNKISLPVIKIEGLGRSLNFKSDISAFLRIRSIIKDFRPDIIHTHTAKAGFLGRLASLTVRCSARRVHTFHGHLLSGYFTPFKTSIVIGIERFLALFTDRIVGVGQKVVDDLVDAKIGKPSQFIVINPGLDIQSRTHRNQVRKKLGLDNDTFVVSWVGRLTEIKSPERVIEIARFFVHSKEKVKFIMVGGGSLLESLKLQSKELPIVFLGWRNDPEDLIAASDLLLMTSKNEGTPISAIQAQVLGIPVLSTDVGAIREIVTDHETGYVRAYDPVEFSELVMRLATDKVLWLNQSNHSKSRAQGKFTVNRLVKDHENLYHSLMANYQSN